MKQGLKQKLTSYLEAQGGKTIPIAQIEILVKQWGYKISNYERRLRECPQIGKQFKDGAIIGYYYKTDSQLKSEIPNYCCYSSTKFFDRKTGQPIHERNCIRFNN